jgi:uncharacterized membrane protein
MAVEIPNVTSDKAPDENPSDTDLDEDNEVDEGEISSPETKDRAVVRLPDGEEIDAKLVNQMTQRVERQLVQIRREIHRGPLPSPAMLREYEDVVPGLAERIVRLTEKEQDHRHYSDKRNFDDSLDIAKRGQHYGLVVVLVGFFISAALVLLGHPIPGTIIGGIDLVALATVFVIGQQKPPGDDDVSGDSDEPDDDQPPRSIRDGKNRQD